MTALNFYPAGCSRIASICSNISQSELTVPAHTRSNNTASGVRGVQPGAGKGFTKIWIHWRLDIVRNGRPIWNG